MTDQMSMLSDAERPRESVVTANGAKPLASQWSARQRRAIASYCRTHNAVVQPSTYPIAFFTDKATGATVKVHSKELLDIYDAERKETARERARSRRRENS